MIRFWLGGAFGVIIGIIFTLLVLPIMDSSDYTIWLEDGHKINCPTSMLFLVSTPDWRFTITNKNVPNPVGYLTFESRSGWKDPTVNAWLNCKIQQVGKH